MTPIRRRAILAAVVGAFAQTAAAQKKEREAQQRQKERSAYPNLDAIRVDEIPQTTALALVITKTDKITAISVIIDGEEVSITPKELMDAVRPHKPVKNECPVCGTMAPPMEPAKNWAKRMNESFPCAGSGRFIGLGSVVNSLCVPATEEMAPRETMVRCKNCNAAFFQDSE